MYGIGLSNFLIINAGQSWTENVIPWHSSDASKSNIVCWNVFAFFMHYRKSRLDFFTVLFDKTNFSLLSYINYYHIMILLILIRLTKIMQPPTQRCYILSINFYLLTLEKCTWNTWKSLQLMSSVTSNPYEHHRSV